MTEDEQKWLVAVVSELERVRSILLDIERMARADLARSAILEARVADLEAAVRGATAPRVH